MDNGVKHYSLRQNTKSRQRFTAVELKKTITRAVVSFFVIQFEKS